MRAASQDAGPTAPQPTPATTPRAGHAPRLSAWWWARGTTFRRAVRTSVLLLLTALVSLACGVLTAQASSPVGPHEATWTTTLGSALTVDLGPLGSVSTRSPAAPLGLRVVLGEIPSQMGVTGLDSSQLTDLLSGDAASYATLVSHPGLTVRAGLRLLAADALRRAGLTASVLLALVAAGRLATRGQLRRSVRALLAHLPATALGGAALAATLAASLAPALRTQPATGTTLPVLAGTALEEARLSGRVVDVVSAYGQQVRGAVEDSARFYDTAETHLRSAWAASTIVPEPVEGAPSEETHRAELATRASHAATTAVLTTDLHCNLDVIALSGVLDELVQPDVHLDDGDLTMTGSSPENVCADALDAAVPEGVAKVFTGGNHDSAATAAHMRSLGWSVTDGTVLEAGGLRVLGDADPTRTTATGTVQIGQEDAQALGERLAEVSCRQGADVDLVLIHQPYTHPALQEHGCAPLLLSGHVHAERGMSVTPSTSSRTGTVAALVSGAGKGGTSFGPVTEDSWSHVLAFDEAGDLIAWRAVALHPDASVTVGDWQEVGEQAPAGAQ